MEKYELTSPQLKTITLLDPNAKLKALSQSASKINKFLSGHQRDLYLMVALRMAETPRVTRTANRCVAMHGEITVPIGAALGDATLSRIGDVGASAQNIVSGGGTFITTAEGEQAVAAQYIEITVEKGILRRSPPKLSSEGI